MNQRALGTSVSTASNWLNNVIIGQITPYGFQTLGWKYFFVYVATNASNAVVSYFLFPETKGKTLEEIGKYSRAGLRNGGKALITGLLFGDTNVRVREHVPAPGMAPPYDTEKAHHHDDQDKQLEMRV